MNSNEIWTAIGALSCAIEALSSCVGALLTLVGFAFVYHQLKEMKTARSMEALSEVLANLSNPETSRARRYVLTEDLPPPGDLPPEVYEKLYSVWVSFNQVGLMVYSKLIPERIVLNMYYGSIIRCWLRLEPYIRREREARGGEYQKHFEYLYHRSVVFRDKHYPHQRFDEWRTEDGCK